MSLYVQFIVLIAVLYQSGSCVDLRPLGEESICPGINAPITVICNLTWTSTEVVRWDVDPNGISRQTVFHEKEKFNFSGMINNVGNISIVSKTSSYIVTRLEVPDSQGLIPMTVTCGDGSLNSEQHYIIKHKADPGSKVPEPPSNVSLQKDPSISGYYILHWQSPSSSAPVDIYDINITAMSSQTFTTTATNLSVLLSNNTNYTVSLKATNCVGSSEETISHIAGNTISETIDSSTSTLATTVTTDKSDCKSTANMNLKDDPLVNGQMLTYIVIAAGSVVLLTISIAVFLATLIYCRRKSHLKSVSMETSSQSTDQTNSANNDNIYNKLKAYSDFDTLPEKQKHFHNPNYSELSLSPTTQEKVDQFTNTDHIYHVLEGPTPETKQEDLYAEVSEVEMKPGRRHTLPSLSEATPPNNSQPTLEQSKSHHPSSSDSQARTWNFSYH